MKMDCRLAASAVAMGLALALTPVPSQAQRADDAWHWRASIYGWFPSIGGSTSYPTGGSGPSLDFDSGDVLSALKFTFMGALDARRGEWGLFTDLIYVDLGGSKSGMREFGIGNRPPPADVSANASLDLTAWVWTISGTYDLARTPRYESQLLFGARMLDLKQTLNWSLAGNIGAIGLPGRSGKSEASLTNWDAVVGAKGVAALSADGRWVVPYYVDVGTGQSKLTWQAFAGLGYRFDWGTTTLGWRYFDYRFKDSAVEDLNFNGAFIGLTFQW